MEKPCENSDCQIKTNSLRHLEKFSVLNITKNKKYIQPKINKTKIEQKLNKRIIINQKRKTDSIPEYTSDMGALSESDVLYYLSDLQNTAYKLNKTYFGKEYTDVNITTNKFLTKINYTYLEKLKLTFDVKLVKFSTILTESSLQKLKDIILKQYYLIEEYVHRSSDLVQLKINYFLNQINNTNLFIENLSEYIFSKTFGYYKILYTSIQNKYQVIKNHKSSLANKLINYAKGYLEKIVRKFENELESALGMFNLENILKKCLGVNFLDEFKDKIDYQVTYEETIIIPFPALPYFEIRISLYVHAGAGLEIAFNTDWLDNFKTQLSFESYAEAKVELGIEGGFYIPSGESPIQISFVVGLNGLIGDGRAGIKLEFTLIKANFNYDIHFIFNAFIFKFYFKIGIKIDLKFFKIKYNIYIFKLEFPGLSIEAHSKKNDKAKSSKGKLLSFIPNED